MNESFKKLRGDGRDPTLLMEQKAEGAQACSPALSPLLRIEHDSDA